MNPASGAVSAPVALMEPVRDPSTFEVITTMSQLADSSARRLIPAKPSDFAPSMALDASRLPLACM